MSKSSTSSKKVFISGVFTLTVSTVLVKLIGLFYKIPMLSYLGSEGMGYFHSAYEIYALFCIIATAGLPVALSVLISAALAAHDREAVERTWRISLRVFLAVGVAGTAIMWILARPIGLWIKSEASYQCMIAIAPTVFFVCVSSALRGFFQGHQRMLPTAISQLIEAFGKLVFGLTFARWSYQAGAPAPTVAAAAGLGLTLGTAVSTLYLIIEKRRTYPGLKQKETRVMHANSGTLRHLARLAIPMTLGASMVSLTKLIDMTMILRRLQSIGYSEIEANAAYGSYATLALSVFALLPTLLNSISLPLVPMLASAIAEQNREQEEKMILLSYRLTTFFAIPSALGIAAFSQPILLLLFGNDPEAVAIAYPLLSMLGVSVFLSCMITATNSVLHAYRIVNRPILSMLAGSIVKLITAYFLIGNANVGLMGAPISSFFCNTVIVLLNLYFAAPYCRSLSFKSIFLSPLLISVSSVGISYGTYLFMVQKIGICTPVILFSVFVAVILYLLQGCLFGLLRDEDICALPMGTKICKILHAVRLLPRQN